MDGPAILTHLKNNPQTSAIPIIFLTAKSRDREKESLKALGAVDVVTKPFDPLKLSALVREIWDRYQKRRETDLRS